jgi:hypothetical protein
MVLKRSHHEVFGWFPDLFRNVMGTSRSASECSYSRTWCTGMDFTDLYGICDDPFLTVISNMYREQKVKQIDIRTCRLGCVTPRTRTGSAATRGGLNNQPALLKRVREVLIGDAQRI